MGLHSDFSEFQIATFLINKETEVIEKADSKINYLMEVLK